MAFSFGELVVILAVGSWAFGPKDLPRIARAVGRLTGRASGLVYRTRARLFEYGEQAELNKLQQEIRATAYQLNAIRSELRGGVNLVDPGPMARRALNLPPPGGPESEGLPSRSSSRGGGAAAGPPPPSFAAAGIAPPPPPPQQQQQAQPQQRTQQPPTANSSRSLPGHIPVSAAAAGLLPERAGRVPSGAEMMLDALREERVAHQALEFMRQQQGLGGAPAAAAAPPPTRPPSE